MKKLLTILVIAISSITVNAQFRMVGSGGWTTLNDSTHEASVTFMADLTGQGYLATQIIEDSFLVFTPTEQTYRIDTVLSSTFSSATIRVVESGNTTDVPIGQILVYNPEGRRTIPNLPFGSTGATAQLNAAVDAWNARQLSGVFGVGQPINQIAFGSGLGLTSSATFKVSGTGYPNTRNDYTTTVPINFFYSDVSGTLQSTKPDSAQVTNPITNSGLVSLRTALRSLSTGGGANFFTANFTNISSNRAHTFSSGINWSIRTNGTGSFTIANTNNFTLFGRDTSGYLGFHDSVGPEIEWSKPDTSIKISSNITEFRGKLSSINQVRLMDADNSNYVSIQSASAMTENAKLKYPTNAPDDDQVQVFDATGGSHWEDKVTNDPSSFFEQYEVDTTNVSETISVFNKINTLIIVDATDGNVVCNIPAPSVSYNGYHLEVIRIDTNVGATATAIDPAGNGVWFKIGAQTDALLDIGDTFQFRCGQISGSYYWILTATQ